MIYYCGHKFHTECISEISSIKSKEVFENDMINLRLSVVDSIIYESEMNEIVFPIDFDQFKKYEEKCPICF